MDIYEKSVLELLENGPKQRKWLINQLCPKIMSQKKLQKTLNTLEKAEKIKGVSKRAEGSRMWITWYTIPEQEHILNVDNARMMTAIERLKSILFRPPTVDEIAVETGFTPTEAEKLAYKLASQSGWFNPTPELISAAKVKLGEVLICAARIDIKKVTETGMSKFFDYTKEVEDAGIVEVANRFLKKHPNLLPKMNQDGEKVVAWPTEALRFLGEEYKPKDRRVFELAFRFG